MSFFNLAPFRENRRAALSRWRLFLYDLQQWWYLKRTRRRDPVPVWRNAIKAIEGQFGTGMASFFVFLRWLFLLNTVLAAVYLAFVVAPMAVNFNYDRDITEQFQWYNLLDGSGALGQTWLFWGVSWFEALQLRSRLQKETI